MVWTSVFLAALPLLSAANAAVSVNEFKNVGFPGRYFDIASLDSLSSCCALATTPTNFSGPNSPLNEELSVHFRGPISLSKFAAYYSANSDSGSWSQVAYYNSANQTANNVTFLNNNGENSTCLGLGLTYASSNGTSKATQPTILEADNFVDSNQEYLIFSSVKCPESGFSNSCGVYRSGIPAYHGFGGTTKLFLFEFKMPNTTTWVEWNNNMPAIWFLNAKIPRTSQYGNCSCWGSGCGEFDAFEVMNGTQYLDLASTIHTYQGTGNITWGIPAPGYFKRQLNDTMLGGVLFATDGSINVFMPNSLSWDSSLAASTVNGWIPSKDILIQSLSSVAPQSTGSGSSQTGSSSASKRSGASKVQSGWTLALFTCVMGVFNFL